MFRILLIVVLAAAGSSTACAAKQPLSAYDQGWRRVQIQVEAVPIDAVMTVDKDCRIQANGSSFQRFALVSYSFSNNPNLRHKMIVGVPGNLEIRSVENAFANVKDCQQQLQLETPFD